MLVKKNLCLLCILLLMVCLIPVSVPIEKARAVSGVTITEYSGLTFPSGLTEITAGSDGALWFGEQSGTKIGRVTTSGSMSEWNKLYVPLCIATGPDGALWFTDTYSSDTISRFTTDGSWTSYNVGLTGNSEPDGICAGPDGNLWFTEYDADFGNRIGRITTAGVITEFSTGLTPGSGPRGICAGPDGNLWFAEFNGNRIGRITTAGVISEFSAGLTPDSNPHSICVGPDNALWFTEQGADKLGRITTLGTITEYGTTEGAKPEGICVGPDNALWFTESGLTRIGKATIQGLSSFYFAEGYTGAGFHEYLCLGNPNSTEANATVTYLVKGEGGFHISVDIPANSRVTRDVNVDVGEGQEVSIKVESTSAIVAERPMYFNYQGRTGGSDVVGATSTSTTWYFAEGYTGAGFDEYITVLNPQASDAHLTFRFQTQAGEVVRTGQTAVASTRSTFRINTLLGTGYETSLKLESDQPIVAERPMYFNYYKGYTGGHCVMGATTLAKSYLFAEGNSLANFDEYLTLQNPSGTKITVNAVYQLGQGQGAPINRSYDVEAGRRLTIPVWAETGPGKDVSVSLSSASDFLAERPMYFDYQGWTGGHCVIGARGTGFNWFFAEGCTSPTFHEYICLQNPGGTDATVELTYLTQESGALPVKTITVPANARITVPVNASCGGDYSLSARINVISGPGIVAERPMYFNYGGWDGGHDVVGYTP